MTKAYNMDEDIRKAQAVLYKGGLILYPTDTIWGIGCDATNKDAVRRVFELKKRADSKALIVLIDSPAKLNFYVEEVPEVSWNLVELTENPLTIIYPGARNLATNLLADDGSVGIRITREPFSKQLCERFRKAIVSTSANISGQASPHFFDEISPEIINGVDYVVNYRRDDRTPAKPSSVIKLGVGGQIQVIRP